MKAETVYNVIQALSADEKLRLYGMLDLQKVSAKKPKRKKKKLKRKDFLMAMKTSGMNDKAIENVFKKFEKLQDKWHAFIDESFLSDEFKKNYQTMVVEKFKQLEIS